MTLDQVMKRYETAMGNHKRGLRVQAADTPTNKLTQLQRGDETVYDLEHAFSLMFWRLYPDSSLVSGLDFDTPIVSADTRHWPSAPGHRHNYLEISYVHKGSLSQVINGVEHTFHEGDVWIMDRNCLHYERRTGHDCFVVFFEIYAEFFDEMFHQAFKNNPAGEFIKEALTEKRNENRFIHFVAEQPIPEVERIFNYALEERERNLPGSDYVIKGLFISLFALLAANYSFTITAKEQEKLNTQMFQEISAYMRANCDDISLESLAKTFYFNKTYMSRLIQSCCGMSYKELLQEIRLEQAAARLTESQESVANIANAVGYRNVSYFYRLFQEKYQMSPNEYRTRFGG